MFFLVILLWGMQVNVFISLGKIWNRKGRGLLRGARVVFVGKWTNVVYRQRLRKEARSPNLAQRGVSAPGDLSLLSLTQIFGNFSVCASLLAVCVAAQTTSVNFLLLTHSSSAGQTFTHLDLKQTTQTNDLEV